MGEKLNLAVVVKAMEKPAGAFKGMEDKMKSMANKAAAMGRKMVVAGGAIVGALGAATKIAANYGDELAKASAKTGIAVESLARMRYAADRSGVSFQGLEGALARMSRSASEANDGAAEYKDTYDALGVSVTDTNGELKDGETLFLELAQALSDVENDTRRAALAQEIFGRSGVQLLPLLNQGAEGIKLLGDRAQELGLVMDGEAAKAAEKFNDALADVKDSLKAAFIPIMEQLAPILSDMAERFSEMVGKVSEWAKEHPTLTKAIVIGTAALGGMLLVVGPILMMLPHLVNGIAMVAKGLPILVTGLRRLVPAIMAVGRSFLVFMLSPIGLVITALALMVKAIMFAFQEWNKMKKAVSEASEAEERQGRLAVRRSLEASRKESGREGEDILAFAERVKGDDPGIAAFIAEERQRRAGVTAAPSTASTGDVEQDMQKLIQQSEKMMETMEQPGALQALTPMVAPTTVMQLGTVETKLGEIRDGVLGMWRDLAEHSLRVHISPSPEFTAWVNRDIRRNNLRSGLVGAG